MENKIIRFGELYQIPSSNGLSRPSAVRGIGFKMINMGELFANNIISDIPMERVRMSENEQKKFFVEQGDLLFARQSLVAEGAGKCSIVKFFNEPTTFESHLIRVRLNQKVANPWYYYYLFQLKSNPIKTIINQCAQAGIRGSELVRVKVPNPPLHTQQKIASILSAYDNLIQNYKKQIEALQTATSELYKEWFVRLRFPGYQTTKFENGIPEGWKIVRFNEIAELINGRAYLMPELQETGKYRIVRVGNFSGKDEWFYSDMELEDNKYCESGDLLYKWACNFGPEIWNEEKVIYHYHIWKVIPNKNNMKKMFLYHLLNFSTPQWLGGTNGTTMVHITKESMEKKRIVLPSFELINEFDIIAENLNKRCRILEQQITNLTQQRDLLLPRLMSGKILS